MGLFYAKTIAFVGRVDRFEDGILYMKTASGEPIKVIKYRGDPENMISDHCYEIRGIVNKDNTISFGETTKFDADFDLTSFE